MKALSQIVIQELIHIHTHTHKHLRFIKRNFVMYDWKEIEIQKDGFGHGKRRWTNDAYHVGYLFV